MYNKPYSPGCWVNSLGPSGLALFYDNVQVLKQDTVLHRILHTYILGVLTKKPYSKPLELNVVYTPITTSSLSKNKIISIFHVYMVWIEKSVTRVTDRHHEAC